MLQATNERLKNALREPVSCEFLLHPEFFENHPYITKKICDNVAHHPNLIFALTISNDSSANLTDNNSKVNSIINEAIKNASASAWSSFMCMLALSSLLCYNVQSVYPDQGGLAGKKLNGTIKPRNSEFRTRDTLAVLWTSSKNAVGMFRPNHFVPLINSSKLNLQKHETTKLEDTARFPNIRK